MSEEMKTTVGALFWIVGIALLVWNLFGCAIYLMDKFATDADLLAMKNGEAMVASRGVYPIWATAAFAIAVWGGLVAVVTLLLRMRLSVMLFVISLVAALICFIPTFTMPVVKAAGGNTYWVMPVIVVVLGLFQIWWSRRQSALGHLS